MQLYLNWLWQGAIITLLVACVVHGRRAMNAATRERIWLITLIAVAGIPVLHLVTSFLASDSAGLIPPDGLQPPLLTVAMPSAGWVILAAVWAAWMMLSLIHIGTACVELQRAKRLAIPFPRDREARLLNWTAVCDRGRPTRLVMSEHVYRAAVLGLHRPVIALAPATIARLTDEELDQIVVHEYAHIQRRDDIALVVQRIMTAIAGMHPVAWWLDRAITTEREVACDDWVVAHTGAVKRYAACLIELASSARPNRWSLSPGVALSRPQLTIRIRRLLDPDRNASIARSRATLWFAPPAVIGVALACAALPLVALAPRESHETFVSSANAAAAYPGGTEAARPPAAESVVVSQRHVAARRQSPRAGGSSTAVRVPTPTSNVLEEHRALEVSFLEAKEDQREDLAVDLPGPAQSLPPIVARQIVFAVEDDGRVEGAGPAPSQELIWGQAAAVGLAIGKGSRQAAVNAAAFFSRFGKSVAGSF